MAPLLLTGVVISVRSPPMVFAGTLGAIALGAIDSCQGAKFSCWSVSGAEGGNQKQHLSFSRGTCWV